MYLGCCANFPRAKGHHEIVGRGVLPRALSSRICFLFEGFCVWLELQISTHICKSRALCACPLFPSAGQFLIAEELDQLSRLEHLFFSTRYSLTDGVTKINVLSVLRPVESGAQRGHGEREPWRRWLSSAVRVFGLDRGLCKV